MDKFFKNYYKPPQEDTSPKVHNPYLNKLSSAVENINFYKTIYSDSRGSTDIDTVKMARLTYKMT